jgi:hypothetical protein
MQHLLKIACVVAAAVTALAAQPPRASSTLSGGHPRGFGSFPRVLGRYVRDEKILAGIHFTVAGFENNASSIFTLCSTLVRAIVNL